MPGLDTPGFMNGAYSVEFDTGLNKVDVGRTEVGFEIVGRPSFVVIRCDETGRTPVDGIWTGVEDIIVRLNTLEWSITQYHKVIDWLYSDVAGNGTHVDGNVNVAGTLASDKYLTLTLTPLTGVAATEDDLMVPLPGWIWTFPLAYCLSPISLSLSAQRLRAPTFEFFVFGDVSGGQEASVYTIDDGV